MFDDEEKSWRDIDRAKDRSPHRKEEKTAAKGKDISSTYAYRSFKSQVNKIFNGDVAMPAAWAEKLGGDPAKSKNAKKTAGQKLTRLRGKALEEALPEYEEKFGFPDDQTILIQLLSVSSADILTRTLDAFQAIVASGELSDARALKVRLDNLMALDERSAILKRCQALLAELKKL